MRFDFRRLVPIFTTTVAVAVSANLPISVSAQDTSPGETPPATELTGTSETADPAPMLAKGAEALKAGDYAAAMAAFNEAGKIAQLAAQQGGGTEVLKAQAAALVGRGRAQAGLKEYDAAEKDFKTVLQDVPTDITALIALGQLRLESEPPKPDEAMEQFQAVLKIDPTNTEAMFGYGKSLVLLGQGDVAVSPLTRVIAADPNNAEAYRLRGSAYAALYKMKQAAEDIHKSIELNPDDYETYMMAGVIDMRGENYQGAVDQMGKAIEHYKPKPGKEDEPFVQGYLSRANAFIELGKKAAENSPEQKAAYQASYDEIEKLIKQLDDKNPTHTRVLAAALFSRGVAERMLGQLGQAIRTFTHAIELRTSGPPDDSTAPFLTDTYYRRGICFHMIGEDKMAISDFESAAHLDTTDPRANLWEGFTYAKMGDYQQAIRAYGDAIAASDRFTPAYYNRGLAYLMMGSYKKAINDFSDAIRLDPTNAEYYFKRGIAYEMSGDYQKASESFSAAIEFDKNHARAHRHMAETLQKLGRSELSSQYRQKADQLAPPKSK